MAKLHVNNLKSNSKTNLPMFAGGKKRILLAKSEETHGHPNWRKLQGWITTTTSDHIWLHMTWFGRAPLACTDTQGHWTSPASPHSLCWVFILSAHMGAPQPQGELTPSFTEHFSAQLLLHNISRWKAENQPRSFTSLSKAAMSSLPFSGTKFRFLK